MINTDDHKTSVGLSNRQSVCRSVADHVTGKAGDGVESFEAGPEPPYHGTQHYSGDKRLHRYVAEFAGRHSRCQRGTEHMVISAVKATVGRSLLYAELVA